MNSSNFSKQNTSNKGVIKPKLQSLLEQKPSKEVKEKCQRAGIMEYVPDPKQRYIIYTTIASGKTEEELRKFFRGEKSLKPSKK